jgi:hypothetical protein
MTPAEAEERMQQRLAERAASTQPSIDDLLIQISVLKDKNAELQKELERVVHFTPLRSS